MDKSRPLFTLSIEEYIELTRTIVLSVLEEQKSESEPRALKDKEETFNIPQLAEFLRCSLVSIHNYKKAGLPFYRIGRKVLFKKDEVMAFMTQKRKRILNV
jgi:excisionase family DNA binding protein